jgi:hypothetical protein
VTVVTGIRVFDVSTPILPTPNAALPAWPDTCPEDDPILAARGVLYSVVFSLPFWLVVASLAWHVVS